MKHFTLILLGLAFTVASFAQDTIANPGFETWNSEGTYNDPASWSCLNDLTVAVSVFTCYEDSTTAHSGKFSAKLITRTIEGHNAPGLISTGQVDANTFSIIGGVPVHSRPTALLGWYLYTPAGPDTAIFNITLTRWDATGDSEIVIGAGQVGTSDTAINWTGFTVPITYYSDSLPDTSLIVFQSSTGNGTLAGSILHLDDISYSYFPVGIKEVANAQFNIYPNPAQNQFVFNNSSIRAQLLSVYSADGKLVQTVTLNDGINTIYTNTLSSGVYILSAPGKDGQMYHSSVVIEK